MGRRSKNEGSVHQLDGQWVAVVELPRTATGRRVRRRRVAATKTEALRLLREMQKEIDQSGSTADVRRSMADAVEAFWRTRQGAVRSTETFERDRWMLDLIVEGLGRKRVATLSVGDCDQFVRSVAEGLERPDGSRRKPLVRAHVSRVLSMLRRVINNELRLGLVVRNVALLAEMPETRGRSRERRILSLDELEALLAASSGAMHLFIDLMGRNGLRPQEARAIEWSAVGWEEGTLEVGPQMNRQGVIVGPKTARAPRTIRIGPATIDRLERWRGEQECQRARAGELWIARYDLVVATRVGTTITGDNAGRYLDRISKSVGLTEPVVIPYDLRHTAITLQSKRGYSDWELADWAGTSERMINEVYRHRTDRVIGVRPLEEA